MEAKVEVDTDPNISLIENYMNLKSTSDPIIADREVWKEVHKKSIPNEIFNLPSDIYYVSSYGNIVSMRSRKPRLLVNFRRVARSQGRRVAGLQGRRVAVQFSLCVVPEAANVWVLYIWFVFSHSLFPLKRCRLCHMYSLCRSISCSLWHLLHQIFWWFGTHVPIFRM